MTLQNMFISAAKKNGKKNRTAEKNEKIWNKLKIWHKEHTKKDTNIKLKSHGQFEADR